MTFNREYFVITYRIDPEAVAAVAEVAKLPVREVVSALHFKADLTLGLGTVAFDYLAR